MPQETSRPLTSSLRLGTYDSPPASNPSEAVSTPQTRSGGLRRALREMRARDPVASRVNPNTLPMPTSGARRSIYAGTGGAAGSRRRRRSSSPHSETNENDEEEGRNDSIGATHPASDLDDRLRRQRYKRRRLLPYPTASASSTAPKKAIKYGYYGQVVPGRLQLELISCDGGEHRDPRHPGTCLGAENLLRHDKSVYCSERPYANVVLRHKDERTPFCLEKLWIVGPEGGFTAPVREGTVHVAMSVSDLQKYIDPPPHARLSRFNTSPRRDSRRERVSSIRSSPERLTLAEALRDPEVVAAYQEIVNEDEAATPANPSAATAPRNSSAVYDYPISPLFNDDPELRALAASAPPRRVTHQDQNGETYCIEAPSTPPNDSAATASRPVTLLTDEDPGPEDTSPQEVLDYRLQRLRLARRRLEAENWDRAERWGGINRLDALMARSRVRDEEGDGDATELESGRLNGSETAPPAAPSGAAAELLNIRATPTPEHTNGNSVLHTASPSADVSSSSSVSDVTTAHFHISPHKNKVALQFDPPLSGRFLLLKLCADPGRSNVDVQSVIAVGYGGGRFFPAVGVR